MRLQRARRRRHRWVLVLTSCSTALVALVLVARFGPCAPAPPAPRVAGPIELASPERPAGPVRITLRDGAVLLDGVEIGRTDGIRRAGRVQRHHELDRALRERRRRDRLAAPTGPVSTRAILDVQDDEPAFVVKSIYQTIGLAGFTDLVWVIADGGTFPP